MKSICKKTLAKEHSESAIKERLSKPQKHNYLADTVLGAIDGCVTTFAIVASSVGAGLSNKVALVLGVANLLADGFSMAASNYQAAKSRQDLVKKARRDEELHIELFPEGEKEEVRQIFANKGFSGDILEKIVEVITSDKKLWINTMLQDEHGLQTDTPSPFISGLTTFVSFVIIGSLPLSPFLASNLDQNIIFEISCLIAAITFLLIGITKGIVLKESILRSGFTTFILGGGAAIIAYMVGEFSKEWIG